MPYSPTLQSLENDMDERFLEDQAEEALLDTPVVLIVRPWRAGKTTLERKMDDCREHAQTLPGR